MRCLKNVSGEMHRVLSFFFIFYFFPKQTLGYRSCKIMLADFRDLGLIVFILHLHLLVHGVTKSRTRLHFHFHFSLSCIGAGNGNPLQCSCLENPRDGGAWWAAVYGVAQSRTQLKRLSSSSM